VRKCGLATTGFSILRGAIAAACLAGCAESDRLAAYRDSETALPAAKTGVKPSSDPAPTGDLCIINIRRDGSLWTRPGHTPTPIADLPRLISKAHASKGSLVLRCDRSSRWKHVAPVLIALGRADVPRLWFEVGGDALMDYRFPEPPGDVVIRAECWISIRSSGKHDVAETPRLELDALPMKDWDQLQERLRRCASIPHGNDIPVVLDADGDAFFGWVIRALDCLREFGFHDIAFLGVEAFPAPVPEPVEEEGLTVEPEPDEGIPIEDIPIKPKAESVK